MRRETKRRNVMLGWYHSVLEMMVVPVAATPDRKRGKQHVE
jgi:hypothetical protein